MARTQIKLYPKRSWVGKRMSMELHGDRPRLGLPLDTVAIASSLDSVWQGAAGSAWCQYSRVLVCESAT